MERVSKSDGFYGSAGYRLCDWFELGVYYSAYYRNRDDRDGTKTPYDPPFNAFHKDTSLSFRFDLNPQWTFKLEGHLLNGTGLANVQDNLDDEGVLQLEKKWALLAAKMTFSF
ncbi:MAG: hypothetical protein GY940_15390, partial [bacterium]|nr:hypothetical protein [bacterium]